MTDKPKPVCRKCKHYQWWYGSIDICALPSRMVTDYVTGFENVNPCHWFNSKGECDAFEPMPKTWFNKLVSKLSNDRT